MVYNYEFDPPCVVFYVNMYEDLVFSPSSTHLLAYT
jgi:hypothetical protein